MKQLLLNTSKISLGLFGLFCAGLIWLEPSGAYFSSQVVSMGSFTSSNLEINLDLTEGFDPTSLTPDQTTSTQMILSNLGLLDIKYALSLSPNPNSDLCENLDIELNYNYFDASDDLITEELYTGTVSSNGYSGAPDLMQIPNAIPFQPNSDYADNQHWLSLDVTLPYDADPTLQNQTCQFQLVANAWQHNLDEGQGFTDSDSLNFSLSSGNWEVCEPGTAYAETITANQGLRKNGTPVLAARSDPEVMKGPADGQFYSLGFGGDVTLEFEYPILNGTGNDLVIAEITNGRNNYPEELATVEISQDGSNWVMLGTATSKVSNGINQFDFDDVGMPWARYVRITDISDPDIFENTADGFDIDTVYGIHGSCHNPESACSLIEGIITESMEQTPLEDQVVALLRPENQPVQTLSIDSANHLPTATLTLEEGKTYLFEATGTWANQNGARLVDSAGHYSDDNWNTWDDFRNEPGRDPRQLTITLDEEFVEWGGYNPDHRYKILVQGEGETVDLLVFDSDNDPNPPSWYNDNSGNLTVRIYDVTDDLATTDENGRYSFESCLPGTHQLVWLSEANFELNTPKSPDYYHFDLMNIPNSADFQLVANPFGGFVLNSPLVVELFNLFGWKEYDLEVEYTYLVDETEVGSGFVVGGVIDDHQLSRDDFVFETCSGDVCVQQEVVSVDQVTARLIRAGVDDLVIELEEYE